MGWNMSVSNLRFEGDYVLVDVDASPSQAQGAHAKPEDMRFGLYGALAHPIEANAIGGCRDVTDLAVQPLSAPTPDRITGTACLGPLRDHSQVRGAYVYSPRDRTAGTTTAYAAAFPVGLVPAKDNDTGLTLKTTSVDAFRADGAMLDTTALGDPQAFTGDGYMLLGIEIGGLAVQYRDVSVERGGPTMVLVAPTRRPPGLSHHATSMARRCWCCPTPIATGCRCVCRCAPRARSTRRCWPRRCHWSAHTPALWTTDE